MGRRRLLACGIAAPLLLAGLAAAPASGAAPQPRSTSARSAPATHPLPRPARPRRVTGLAAYEDGATVTLGWHLQADPSIARVVVRYTRGRQAPQSPRVGTPARPDSARATTATLSGLAANHAYSATVWTRDAKRRLSVPATITFTTAERVSRSHGSVAGLVTDREGAPLSDVAVTASGDTIDGKWSTVTGPDGQYQLALPVGSYELTFDGAHGQGGSSDATGYVGDFDFAEVAGRTVSTVNAALRPGADITGRITDPAGNPISGAEVSTSPIQPYVWPEGGSGLLGVMFSFVSGGAMDLPTTSDANGEFRLTGIAHHAVLVCVDPSGAGVSGGTGGEVGYTRQCTSSSLLPRPGATLSVAAITLNPRAGGAAHGIVQDIAGHPVPGADVVAIPVGQRYSVGWAVSGADGGYRIAALRPGSYRICAVHASVGAGSADLGYAPRCRRRTVPVADGRATSADVTLPRGAALSGTVRAVGGAPVFGAQIQVMQGRDYVGWTVTDAAGHWSAPGLANGRYAVCTETGNATTAGSATGVVSGCFEHRKPVRVREGVNRIGVDLRLRPGGAIAGRTLQSNGRPLKWAAVLAARPEGGADPFSSLDLAGRGGYYRLTGLRPGSYRVCAAGFITSAQESQACQPRKITVRAGHTTPAVDFTFAQRASLAVDVTDEAGRPLAGVDAAVLAHCRDLCETQPPFAAQARVVASRTTNARGLAVIRAVRAGTYAVCAFAYDAVRRGSVPPTGYADTCSGPTFTVTVVPGQRATTSLTLPVAGEVTGTVTDAAGHPLRGVRVDVSRSAAADVLDGWDGPGDPTVDAVTGADGSYAIRSVAAGDRTVCFDASRAVGGSSPAGYLSQCIGGTPGGHTATPVPVVAGQITSGQDLALTAAGGISGRVSDASGKRPADRWLFVDVLALHSEERLGFARIGGRGTYRIPQLAPGSYRVCFEASRYARQCYRDQPWNGGRIPAGVTPVPVSSGAITTGVDAVLAKR